MYFLLRGTALICLLSIIISCCMLKKVSAQNCTASCVHGTCNASNACVCNENWSGINCTTFICEAKNPCRNGATCRHGSGNQFVCDCKEGFSGLFCDCNNGRVPYKLCNSSSSLTCAQQGTCVIDPYSHNETCICDSGYGGLTCSDVVNYCHINSCFNGGTCILTDNYFNCLCHEGYDSTTYCKSLVIEYDRHGCGVLPCQNGATCEVPFPLNITTGPYYNCVCPPGYTGVNCSVVIDFCSPSPCQNDGNCTDLYKLSNITDYKCTCPPYRSGKNCEMTIDPCDGMTCTNGGQCISSPVMNVNGTYNYTTACNCTEGFTGDSCQSDINECQQEGICANNGTCINQFGSYTCTCITGYTGRNCLTNINDCKAGSCSNGGHCMDGLNSYSCNCTGTGYTGKQCTISLNNTCDHQSCYYGGICQYNSGLGYNTCTCPSGYIGELCLYKYQHCIASGYCNISGTSHCGNHGNTCICRDGYTGVKCDVMLSVTCDCPNEGTCILVNNQNQCVCPSHVNDTRCNSCNNCANNGTCTHVNGRTFCTCKSGWGGVNCTDDIDECFTSPCTNGGTCINNRGSYTCTCPRYYTGVNCETFNKSCDVMRCMNGGTCNNDTCTCPPLYTGEYCEIELCPHSNCSSLANNGICDLHCFNAPCGYDGGQNECSNYSNAFPNPWSGCDSSLNCSNKYSNSHCDQECNNALCLFDGNDCLLNKPSCPPENITLCSALVNNGVCDEFCNTLQCHIDTADCSKQVYLPGTLVLILFSSQHVSFNSQMDQFRTALSRLINAEVEVTDYKVITKTEAEKYNHVTVRDSSTPLIYWKVTMRVNIQYCIQACPTSINQVLRTIQAFAKSKGQVVLDDFSVVGAVEGPPPSQPTTGSKTDYTQVIAISVSVAVCVIIVIVVMGVLGKRVRDNGGVSQTVKKVRARGTWFISRSNGGESDSVPTTRDPSISDQRSTSREFIVEPYRKRDHAFSWVPLRAENSGALIGEKARDPRKWTPLHCEACRSSGEHVLREIIHQNSSIPIDVQGPGGFTPLMVAIVTDKQSPAPSGVRKSVPVVRSDSSSSSEQSESNILITPYSNGSLMSPAMYHHSFTPVGVILNQRADVNVVNDYGQTALHLAARQGRDDYVLLLLSAKADPNIQDIWGQTPLHVAIGAATDRAFKALIDYPKTSTELKSLGGITPLMMTVKMANISMLQQLLARNADISATDNEGRTAVHWAAMINSIDSLKLLLKQGPDNVKDAPNAKGETALYLGCREGSTECVQYLLFECCANNTLLDMLDKSPLQVAYERQHADIVELLKCANGTPGAPPPLYTPSNKMSNSNPLFGRNTSSGSIKLEPNLALPPSYQQSVSLPVAMSLPYAVQYPPNGILATTSPPETVSMATTKNSGHGLPRVSSIEAELEQLVSSAALQFTYPSPHFTTGPQVRGGDSPGHSGGVSPGSLHHDYSPISSTHSPSVYHSSSSNPTPPSVHDHGSSQPLKHLPLTTYHSPPSNTDYNTALQSISHTQLPGGHSPPIGHHVTTSDSSLPLVPATTTASSGGFSPHNVPNETRSPSTGYHGFPSPPKEVGELVPSFCTAQAPPTCDNTAVDIINSLTPSPEDYSQTTPTIDNSPPQPLEHHSTVLHYAAYNYSTLQPSGQFNFTAGTTNHLQPPLGMHFHHHESTV